MKIAGSLCVALAGAATIVDQVTAREAYSDVGLPPATCPPTPLQANHDKIVPFLEPTPQSTKEKAAVDYKPLLTISRGCDPYPAVDLGGSVSRGLKPSGLENGECTDDKLGSQVYGRSEWYNVTGKWYNAYAWYFAKEQMHDNGGHRHGWQTCVLWLDNPGNELPKIEGVSVSGQNGFVKHVPPQPNTFFGTHVKLRYFMQASSIFGPYNKFELETTEKIGGFQALIQWHQLPEQARCALNNMDWENGVKMPINDANIGETLRAANPF